MKKKVGLGILTMAMLLGALAGCGGGGVKLTQRYSSSGLGISLQYPEDWIVNMDDAEDLMLSRGEDCLIFVTDVTPVYAGYLDANKAESAMELTIRDVCQQMTDGSKVENVSHQAAGSASSPTGEASFRIVEDDQTGYFMLYAGIQAERCIVTGYAALEGRQAECKRVYDAVMDTLKVESTSSLTDYSLWVEAVNPTEDFVDQQEETSDVEPLGEMTQREYLGDGYYELQIPRWNLALTYPDYMEISENVFDGRATLIDMNYFMTVEDIYAKWINSTLDADSFLQQYMEATVYDYVPIMFGDVIEFYNYKNQGAEGDTLARMNWTIETAASSPIYIFGELKEVEPGELYGIIILRDPNDDEQRLLFNSILDSFTVREFPAG